MRPVYALVLVGVVAGSCVGDGPPPPTESLLVLDAHRAYARNLGNVWSQAVTWCGGVTGVDSSEWETDKRIWVGERSHPRTMSVTFSKLGYDAEQSTITYGSPDSTTTVVDPLVGHDYIFDLRDSTEAGDFRQTDKVTLDRSRSVTVTEGVEMDLTVETDTKIEGSYAGVKLEEDLKATFGISKTSETATATAESTSVETEHEFAVKLDPGKITRVRLTAGNTSSATPVTVDAVADWTATWELGHFTCGTDSNRWNCAVLGQDCTGPVPVHPVNRDNQPLWACWQNYRGHSGPPPVCAVTMTLDETEAAFYGRTAAWAGMDGWLAQQPASTTRSLEAAVDPANRKVVVAGIQHTTAEHTDLQVVTTVPPADLDGILSGGAEQCDPTGSC
ncbi:MAG: hypothetical protein OXI18_11590 [bacterium]|nr:hypothetical protein [bacterium]